MDETGYEDCDYIGHELGANWWIKMFGDAKFHNTEVELDVPCRDPTDHLMSQCNYQNLEINCEAENDEAFYESIENCFVYLGRYYGLRDHFDVKCFDFHKQFTNYVDLCQMNFKSAGLYRSLISKERLTRSETRQWNAFGDRRT